MDKKELTFKLGLLALEYLEECGSCDCYHPSDFYGDCRDDKNRYGDPSDLVDKWLKEV